MLVRPCWVALLLTAAACTRLQDFTCDDAHPCGDGRECRQGVCIPLAGDGAPLGDGVAPIDDDASVVDAHVVPCNFDGVVDDGEECDDGDHDDLDGCVSCAAARCGDGHVRAGVEECDPPGATCTAACLSCPSGTEGLGGDCWEVTTADIFWDTNKACNLRAGGHAATATTDEEIDGPLAAAFAASREPQVYVGLSDSGLDGDWYFINGETLARVPWTSGDPSGGAAVEHAVVTATGWHSVAQSVVAKALCEREPAVTRAGDRHAYRREYDSRTHGAYLSGCAFGGAPVVLDDVGEMTLLQGQMATRSPCVWVGATYAGGVVSWARPTSGDTPLPWASSEPSMASGCVCLKPTTGLAVRSCTETRESWCEVED